jgi:hypothetical protein
VDIDGNNTLWIKAIGVTISTFETRPTFQWLIQQFDERMIVLSNTASHAAAGDPANLKLCQRGEWQDRLLVETVLSMLTLICHCKKGIHRGWAYF